MHKFRKLINSGLRAAISAGLKLPTAFDPDCPNAYGHIGITLGGRPSIVSWEDIANQEVRVSVWFDYRHDRNPAAERERFLTGVPIARRYRYPEFLGAMACAWLERQRGNYIQGIGIDGIIDTYARRDVASALGNLEDLVLAPGGPILRGSGPFHF